MFSCDLALVYVSNNHGHEILLDSRSSLGGPSDKEFVASTYEDIANDVTEQIDVLLKKYRSDNEESIMNTPTSGEASDKSIEQEQ
jgi:hypothetical protein